MMRPKYRLLCLTPLLAGFTLSALTVLPCVAQGQRKGTSVVPVVSRYSQTPFDLTFSRLPVHFMGHDIVRLYNAAKALQDAKQTEYEATDEFTKRLTSVEDKLFMGTGRMATLAFVVLASSEYNADAQALDVAVKCSDPSGALQKVSQSITVRSSRRERTYVGSNAFGAVANVHSTRVETFGLNVSSCPPAESSIGNIDPDEARRIKATLSGLVICSMKRGELLTTDDARFIEATFDRPNEYFEKMYFLRVHPLVVWFFDSSTGEIYTKAEANEESELP